MHSFDRNEFIHGIKTGIPVFLGYFPVAVAFGLLAKTTGLLFSETVFFSAAVFAGASQFIALNMIGMGALAGEIVITVFLINFRHLLMSSSLASVIKKKSGLMLLASFGVTDETFAVSSLRRGEITAAYMTGLNLTAYSGWVSGTIAGYLSGSFIPDTLQSILAILLYVLFISILVPQIKKSLRAFFTAALAALINTVLVKTSGINPGWCIIFSILAASTLTMVIFSREDA